MLCPDQFFLLLAEFIVQAWHYVMHSAACYMLDK